MLFPKITMWEKMCNVTNEHLFHMLTIVTNPSRKESNQIEGKIYMKKTICNRLCIQHQTIKTIAYKW